MPKVKVQSGRNGNSKAREFLSESAEKLKSKVNSKTTQSVQPTNNVEQKPLNVLPVTSKSLVHDDGRQYDFHSKGEDVAVVMTGKYHFSRVMMPRDEALYLWNRLRKQGFEQW